jgi:hypothetical protein
MMVAANPHEAPQMITERLYVVDRIEGTIAVLIDDDGRSASVPLERLPNGVEEGIVLRVTLASANVPNWSHAAIDQTETKRRRQEAEELRAKLEDRDPGGDIES